MHLTDTKRERGSFQSILALALGGLLALGAELIILLLSSLAVSMGVIRMDATPQLTAAACLCGCFIGGRLTCTRWRSKRLIGGILTGILCFLLILVIASFSGKADIGVQALLELSGCIVGGGLAGTFLSRRKKQKRKVR